jgi:hypothetical protein
VLGSRTICACATVGALYAVAKVLVVARKETARWLANNISYCTAPLRYIRPGEREEAKGIEMVSKPGRDRD